MQLQQHTLQYCCLSLSPCLTMALPVVVFLLALTSVSGESAPDCKDVVKPFMPQDPKLVSCAYDPFSVLFIPLMADLNYQ